ncbi:ATP-binding protein [Streptomyces sp. NPDC056169]|uniref:ATP-binding protein n=1 Tax=Streptomyces sp. NPDC056169 TaxID=3345734 RepID=UPI0035D7E4A8
MKTRVGPDPEAGREPDAGSGPEPAPRRRRARGPRTRPFGLRTRLVLAFLLVAAVGCGTTAALTYRAARNAILEQVQDTAMSAFREQVQGLGTSLPVEADTVKSQVLLIARQGKPRPWRVYAEYGALRVSSADRPTSSVITPELRARANASAAPHGSFQRVVKNGIPYLTMAVPTVFYALSPNDDATQPTGLVFYAVMELDEEEANIEAMVTAARDGALPALAVALIPALLAARGVLRPVRELRLAAHNMGRGRLDTRIQAKGSDELSDLARTFNESAAELERSVAELRRAETRARRFASDVSHELRTPLAGMLAVTEVLDEDADSGTLDSDTARAVRLISAETGRLAVLVEDLMEISRFDARAAELHTDEVDAADCVRMTLRNRHWTDPASVVPDLAPGIRARLDPRRFDVVVANLVGNALRHGGAPVTVRVYEEGDHFVTEVADRGPGIHPDVLPHVFDRFYKADPARTRSAGSGLGLAITLENVRLHGGTVEAANHPGGGAVFTVRMPR